MKEASVAGESPDRSKQRESSAEPTSGSAGPVPEARGEVRDPRLAVKREGEQSSSASRRGVDTATQVLSIRTLTEEREQAEEPAQADAGDSRGPEDAQDAVKPSDAEETPEKAEKAPATAKPDPADDARLRAAVAAWVSTAAEKAPEKDAGQTVEDAKPAAKDADTDTDSAPADSKQDAEPAAVDSRTNTGQTAVDSETETETASQDSQSDAAKTTQGSDTDTEAAAEDSKTETKPASQDSQSDAAKTTQGSDTDTEAAAEDSKTETKPASQDSQSSDTDTEPAAEGSKTETETTSQDSQSDAAKTTHSSDTDTEPAAEESDGDAGSAPEDSETDNGPESAAGDRTTGADPQAADGEDAPQGPPAPDDESSTGGAGGNEPAEGEAEDAHPVDQPTAVFKAPRPAKPAVDQPTTMLKLGGATKPPQDKAPQDKAPQDKAPQDRAPKPGAPAAPDVPAAERTSRFVALKPLDDPSPRAPKPAEATAAIPQVGPERTAQQPLPPKPPLDLLAELTNTPPPPPTPLRTLARRIKIWTPLVILLAIVFAIAQAVRPLPAPALTLTADDSYTFDGAKVDLPWPSEGQGWMDVNGIGTMGSFGKQTPVAIGSVAKAMTAYVVLKDHPLKPGEEGPSITVDATAEKEGGYYKDGESTLYTVKENDKLTEKQALSAIMIPSANNIARLLARWDAGTEAAFIKKMNDTAKELGMTNTTYTDASGLKETTVSTAQDQVKLGNELVKIQALMDITKLPEWIDPSGMKHRNYNTLVPYNNALGIKTGSTTKAGGNLLFAATKEVGGQTVTLIGAILGQHTIPIIDTVNAVSKTALLAAQDAITSAKILKKGDVVGYVDDKLGGHTPVVVTKDVAAVGWAGLEVKLSFEADELPHSAASGTKVGTLTVGDGTNGAVQVPVALEKDLLEPGFTDKLTRVS
ncbi:D-alanyl-D-alanine carboxypeptidase [Streptomyces sp. HUAS ZL42]|uniref:D-alanyl-D-alanine carboxypeptidase n=1 Tax=Streptomyces sp. HUAS ZL42 TaxID=3231715 RepID=UPI00345E9933